MEVEQLHWAFSGTHYMLFTKLSPGLLQGLWEVWPGNISICFMALETGHVGRGALLSQTLDPEQGWQVPLFSSPRFLI